MTAPRPEPPPIPLRREILRVFLALVLAPLVVPLLALLLLLATGTIPTSQNIYRWSFFAIALPFNYAVGAMVGFPVYLVFRYLRWRAWWHYALAGFFGAYGFAEYLGPGRPSVKFLLFLGFYGVVTACTAWAIVVADGSPTGSKRTKLTPRRIPLPKVFCDIPSSSGDVRYSFSTRHIYGGPNILAAER